MDLVRTTSERPRSGRRLARLLGSAALATGVLMASTSPAAVFYANNDNDAFDISPGDGECWTGAWVNAGGIFSVKECSFRAAIQETNALAGADEIRFANFLPVDTWGNVVIRPNSALPAVTQRLTIDGRIAPGYDADDPGQDPVIVLDGVNAVGNGLWFTGGADFSELHALAIVRFPASGVRVGGADNMKIQGNHVGLYRGFTPLGNGGHGITVTTDSTSNVIGEDFIASDGFVGRGNVICGNDGDGILVGGSYTSIGGNRIGTDRAGNTVGSLLGDYSNHGWGVRTYGSGSNITIGRTALGAAIGWQASGNVIAGNDDGGILVEGAQTAVSILANHIGVGANGTSNLGNGTRSGIEIRIDGVVVGDDEVGGNVISGHDRYGIEVSTAVDGVRVIGNVIGLDEAAQMPVPNDLEAVLVIAGADHVYSKNVVAGNGDDGLYLNGDRHVVNDNYLGTNEDGADLGNGGWGVVVNGDQNQVGTTNAGNVVGFNDLGGVKLDFDNAGALVMANWIGVDPLGRSIGNDGPGLLIQGPDNAVGGAAPSIANTIGNNAGHGIQGSPNMTYNRILGNYVGTDVTLADHGNQGAGILLPNAFGSEVGSDETTPDVDVRSRRNVIAWNSGDGIRVTETGAGFDNALRGNFFLENGELPIDLANDGTTANDPGDYDGGANWQQNTPVLDAAGMAYDGGANWQQNTPVLDAGGTGFDWPSSELDVRYSVSSETSQSAYPIRVDFHLLASDGVSPGEWIGSDLYAAPDAMLGRDATIVPAVPMVGNEMVMAIATDDDGNSSEAGNLVSVPEPGFAGLAAAGALSLAGLGRCRRGRRA